MPKTRSNILYSTQFWCAHSSNFVFRYITYILRQKVAIRSLHNGTSFLRLVALSHATMAQSRIKSLAYSTMVRRTVSFLEGFSLARLISLDTLIADMERTS